MQCPNDNATLLMTTRDGIEIDYCPTCRGVWLDRGELDKLIERSNGNRQSVSPAAPERREYRQPESRHYEERHRNDDDDHYHKDHHNRHKKESFLGDLFDF